jgi:hypothetical protein
VAVVRERGDELPVPSIVHWRQEHYGAIVGRDGGFVLVYDTLYHAVRHFAPADINAEASGTFLVPQDQVPKGWRLATDAEARSLPGRSNIYLDADPFDKSCKQPCPPGCAPGPGGAGGGSAGPGKGGSGPGAAGGGSPSASGAPGAGAGATGGAASGSADPALAFPGLDSLPQWSGCDGCAGPVGDDAPIGMPRWTVSEPWLNLWLYDEPMAYTPATGPRVAMQLSYKQRPGYLPADNDGTLFRFGDNWFSTWRSYVEQDGSEPLDKQVLVHLPGGGISRFAFTNGLATDYDSNLQLRVLTNALGVQAYELTQADGSKATYDFKQAGTAGEWSRMFLGQSADLSGRSLRFQYLSFTNGGYGPYDPISMILRLRCVLDADGRTNQIDYAADIPGLSPPALHRVGGVTNLFYGWTAKLAYSTNRLIAIIDAAGISNALAYGSGNALTTLTTPYGPTTFQSARNEGTDPVLDYDRSVVVREPNGARQIFAFIGSSSNATLPAPYAPPTGAVPANCPLQSSWNTNSADLAQRNTFYWNRLQAEGVPDTWSQWTSTNLSRARMRHWLCDPAQKIAINTLALEIAPSPSGSPSFRARCNLVQPRRQVPARGRRHPDPPGRRGPGNA